MCVNLKKCLVLKNLSAVDVKHKSYRSSGEAYFAQIFGFILKKFDVLNASCRSNTFA